MISTWKWRQYPNINQFSAPTSDVMCPGDTACMKFESDADVYTFIGTTTNITGISTVGWTNLSVAYNINSVLSYNAISGLKIIETWYFPKSHGCENSMMWLFFSVSPFMSYTMYGLIMWLFPD